MQDELYINGEAVDLGGKAVNLEYINNVLSDIDKISSSHSYTIKLPLTSRNSRIFDMVENVAHVSSKVGVYLPAEYRRNGVTITKDAQAYVTEASPDGISICLVWDSFAALSTWLKSGKTLRDLSFDYFQWDAEYTPYRVIKPDVLTARYDTGVPESTIYPTPTVTASAILRKIMQDAGIPFSYSLNALGLRVSELAIPLCSRGGAESPGLGGILNRWTQDSWGGFYPTGRTYGTMSFYQNGAAPCENVQSLYIAGRVKLNKDVTVSYVPYVEFRGLNGDSYTVLATFNSVLTNDGYVAEIEGTFDVSSFSEVRFEAIGVYTSYSYFMEGNLTMIPTTKVAVIGNPYDVSSNLPDMSQVDFVKALCTLCGMQVVVKDNSLMFLAIETILANRAQGNIEDWSNRVVNYTSVPTSVLYKIGDYAQRNWFLYAEDSENEGYRAEGVLTVNDATLDAEKDLVTIPFAASLEQDGVASIHHYELDDNGGVSDVEVEPRICLMEHDTTHNCTMLQFPTKLTMQAIIANRYNGLSSLVNNAHQLCVYARLSEYDLAGLDWARPVYLAQTGQYYIVSKVSTDTDSDICEVTLWQLNDTNLVINI